jgi:multiple sugar transport system substrate-binding protein
MTVQSKLSRRQFLKMAGLGVAGSALAACAPAPTSPAATVAPAEAATVAATAAPPAADATATPAVTAVPAAADAVAMSYWHIWGGARVDQLQTVLNDFMLANPNIKVETLLLPNPGYADKIMTALAADPPDLAMIYTDEFAPAASRNALRQVDDLMAADGLTPDTWYPGVYNMSTWQNKTFGLPFVGNFLQFLYWNRDDYAAGGLDPERGQETWDEVKDMATKLTKITDGKVEHLGYVPNGSGEWIGGSYRNGLSFWGDGTPEQVAIGDPKSLEALQYCVDLYEALGGWDAVGATLTGWGNQQLGNPMIAGVASAIWSGVFTVNVINQQKPDLNYKIGKIPHGPNGEFLDVITQSWSNCIPAQAKHPDEAWALAKYMSAEEGHLKFMVELQSRPAMVQAFNVAPHDAVARQGNPYWDIVLEVLEGQQASWPVSDKMIAAQAITTETFESVMLGQRTPEEGVAWAQEEVVKIFAEE